MQISKQYFLCASIGLKEIVLKEIVSRKVDTVEDMRHSMQLYTKIAAFSLLNTCLFRRWLSRYNNLLLNLDSHSHLKVAITIINVSLAGSLKKKEVALRKNSTPQ